MRDLLDDLRVALRQWRRRPVLPLTMIALLSAGLGATAATVAICRAVLWKAPGDVPADRLVWIGSKTSADTGQSSPGAFSVWRTQSRTLTAAAVRPVTAAIEDEFGTDRVRGALVTANLFDTVGIRAVAGRTLGDADAGPDAAMAVLISHGLWQRRYAADTGVMQRRVVVNGTPATIVGVLPRDAEAVIGDAEWCAPLVLSALDQANFGPRYLGVVGRLEPGVSIDQASAELDALVAAAAPAVRSERIRAAVTPLLAHQTSGTSDGLLLLLAAISALGLIAVINAASLLVARTTERASEFALRACLGASRQRRARLLFAEAGTIAALSVAAGTLLALWLIELLRAVLPAGIPRLGAAQLDLPTTLFIAAAGMCTALGVGLVPAFRAGRSESRLLARSSGHGRDRRWDSTLVVAQVSLAVVLACGAGLLVRSARALDLAPRGYDAVNVYTAALAFPRSVYRDGAAMAGAVNRILGQVREIGGVTSTSVSSQLPFAGGSAGSDIFLADEARELVASGTRQARVRLVSGGYHSTLGIQLRQGREIAETDGDRSSRVVVVNESLAGRLMPEGGTLLGREITFGVPVFNGPDGSTRWTVVGVAADTWDRGPRHAVEPEVLIPLRQTPPEVLSWISGELQLAIRTSRAASAITPDVRAIAAASGTGVALGVPQTLEERIADAFARERALATIVTMLGLAGVTLSLLGLAGLLYHRVQQSRRDIAVRLAIGASTSAVVRRLVLSGAALVGAGVAIGVGLVLSAAPFAAAVLFGIEPHDPLTLGVVAAVVLAVAQVAAWVPARLAATVDPSELLRG